jgi:hypothetical protein
MNREAVLQGLVEFAEDDWLPLWVIVQDVEELLDIDQPDEILEMTVALARELLKHGLRAGDAPIHGAIHFRPWPNQDPDFVADHIRREWRQRDDFPSWGDGPWFARPARRVAGQWLS